MTLHTQTAPIDPWVASSLLQKSIRRSEVDSAIHAARTLHRLRGAGIWRRFLIIASEDIGVGDLDLVRHVAAMSVDRDARNATGTDDEIVTDLARRLAEAPKDRTSDYLICTAIQHPDNERVREAVAVLSTDEQIAIAVDADQPIITRATAVWYASGINGGGPQIVGPGNLPRLLHGFEQLGLPQPITTGIAAAARKTKEPIVTMLPLLWALVQENGGAIEIENAPIPPAPTCRGIPAWAFDKHTRLGKRALQWFMRDNRAVEAVLSEYVPDFRAQTVIEMAAFYADAIPIARRLKWKHSHALEALGLETDMMKIGCPRDGIQPILDTVRANLNHLNDIRCRLFAAATNGERR